MRTVRTAEVQAERAKMGRVSTTPPQPVHGMTSGRSHAPVLPLIGVPPLNLRGCAMRGCSPFLWMDRRGSFHILAHTWYSGAWPLMTISGHAFSRDGLKWTFADAEPYSYNVTYSSGEIRPFATLERPKLLFDEHGVATHLFNGVSSQWPCNGTCAGVKTARGRDWTWTMSRPLDSALY